MRPRPARRRDAVLAGLLAIAVVVLGLRLAYPVVSPPPSIVVTGAPASTADPATLSEIQLAAQHHHAGLVLLVASSTAQAIATSTEIAGPADAAAAPNPGAFRWTPSQPSSAPPAPIITSGDGALSVAVVVSVSGPAAVAHDLPPGVRVLDACGSTIREAASSGGGAGNLLCFWGALLLALAFAGNRARVT